MRKHLLILAATLMLVLLSTVAALASTDTTPTGFCNGTEGWQLDLNNNPAPANPDCGPGSFNVDVTGGIDGPFGSFEDGLNNLRNRGGVGTVWFQPEPRMVTAPEGFCAGTVPWILNMATESPVDPQCGLGEYFVVINELRTGPRSFWKSVEHIANNGAQGSIWFEPEPTAQPQPVTAPAGFCSGYTGWVINLETDYPQNPNCGPGTYTVSYSDTVSHHIGSFEGAVMYIHDVGDMATLWFHPEPQPVYAPAGFCEGNVGWPINLVTDMPEEPGCGSGEFFVDVVSTLNGPFNAFKNAVENLQARGGNGALWFEPALDPLPTPDPQPTYAPEHFCKGTIGWPVNLSTDIPQDPGCPSGQYAIDLSGTLTMTVNFDTAVQTLADNGGEGAFWFVPKTNWTVFLPALMTSKLIITAPEGFCDGTAGWPINLATQDPQRPNCEGTFSVEVGGAQQVTASFDNALENLRSRDGVGTLWYLR